MQPSASARARRSAAAAAVALVVTACVGRHPAALRSPGVRPSRSARVAVAGTPASTPLPCGRTIRRTSTRITTYVDPRDGSCVAPADLLRYRCSSETDPVTVVASGSRRRSYVGGRFAVPIRRLPRGARLLGRSSGRAAVYRANGELFVRGRRGLSRWTAAPAPGPRWTAPSVYFLGDSVMLGARSAILARLPEWHVRFDAEVNRSTYRAIDIVRANRGAFRDVAVIQLGTNDAGTPGVFSSHAAELLAELRGLPLVIWLTIRHARGYYAVADELLVKDLAATSDGVAADWDAAQPPGGAGPDGLHLTAVGASAMASLVDGVLTRWRNTGRGTGDTSCAKRAERLAPSNG